jgi:hypothetical protein
MLTARPFSLSFRTRALTASASHDPTSRFPIGEPVPQKAKAVAEASVASVDMRERYRNNVR